MTGAPYVSQLSTKKFRRLSAASTLPRSLATSHSGKRSERIFAALKSGLQSRFISVPKQPWRVTAQPQYMPQKQNPCLWDERHGF